MYIGKLRKERQWLKIVLLIVASPVVISLMALIFFASIFMALWDYSAGDKLYWNPKEVFKELISPIGVY